MKEVTVDGKTYRIRTLAPWMQAYLMEYQRLARIIPESEGDFEKLEAKMRRVTERIFQVVEPKPSEEDAGEVFLAVLKHVNEAFADASESARLFREQQRG